MQSKRREILDLLKEKGSATVDDLSAALGITSVTVRHHLDVLRSEGLVAEPQVLHRPSSGRPQHAYSLTERANSLFPKNYDGLALQLLDAVKSQLNEQQVNVIFHGLATRLAHEAPLPAPGESIKQRAERAVAFLNEKGYVARWERATNGIILHTCNCPYDGVAGQHPELCTVDLSLIETLTGVKPERVCHMPNGDGTCSYLIRDVAIIAT